MSADLRFVDADGHVVEPPTELRDFAPPGYEDRVWHVETDDAGEDWVVIGDRRTAANVFAFSAAGGLPDDQREAVHRGELRYSEMRSGGWDRDTRLADMDAEGIERSVLYPTVLLSFQSQHPLDLVRAQCRAYNDWVSDHVSRSGGRLFAAAIVPHFDVAAAAEEIRRAAELPGIVAVHLRPNPTQDWKPLNDEVYDPLWAAASDTGLVVGFHPLMAADMPGAVLGMRLNRLRTSAIPIQEDDDMNVDNVFFAQVVGNVADMTSTMTFLLAGGVCQRYPDLRVVFLEANGGWLVPWLERLDHHFEMYGWDVPWLTRPPSEYFRRQCWISFDADESTLAFTARSPLCGAERIIWASDYPHPDAKMPGVTKMLAESLAELAPADQRRIAAGNAEALYRV